MFSEGSLKLRILEFKAVDDNSFVFGSTEVYPILSVLLSLDKNLFNDVDCVSQRFCRCVFFDQVFSLSFSVCSLAMLSVWCHKWC